MKFSLVLPVVVLFISHGLTNGLLNKSGWSGWPGWLKDIAKGVSEGVKEEQANSKAGLEIVKDKLGQRIAHPKFKHEKVNLKKVIKKAEKHIEKIHKRFEKLHGLDKANEIKKKHLEAINKWMASLTKIDTDGEEEHNIPFVPKVILHNKGTYGDKPRSKAVRVFERLAKMWDAKMAKSSMDSEKNVPLSTEKKLYIEKSPQNQKEESDPESFHFGQEEKFVQPKYISKDKQNFDALGKDEERIVPGFVKEDFKRKHNQLRMDEKSSVAKDKLRKLHKIDILGKDEKEIMPDFVKKEFENMKRNEMQELKTEVEKKPMLSPDQELRIELLGENEKEKEMQAVNTEKVKHSIYKESEDLEKTVEELIPFLGKEKMKGVPPSKEKEESGKVDVEKMPVQNTFTSYTGGLKVINMNPMNTKSLDEVKGEEDKGDFDEKEEEAMGTKEKFIKAKRVQFSVAEKKIIEEEKAFEEAEKKWEEEIRKKAAEEIKKAQEKDEKKTTQEEEIEEDLQEPTDTVITPPDNVLTTTEPKVSQRESDPLLTFRFEEKEKDPVEKKVPAEERLVSVPRRIKEPANLFKRSENPESHFEEMSDEVKPFFKKLDDSEYRNELQNEEEQWMKLKNWAMSNLFKVKSQKEK